MVLVEAGASPFLPHSSVSQVAPQNDSLSLFLGKPNRSKNVFMKTAINVHCKILY